MNAVVRAISGPLRGALFRLAEGEVTIGRQPSNHLCIGDVSVSRFHCVIKAEDGRYQIKDLKSHNGTLVNGNKVSECFLKPGDQIGIGDTVFEFLEDSTNSPELPVSISDRETVASLRIEQPYLHGPGLSDEASRSKQQRSGLAVVAKIGKLLNSANKLEHRETEILKTICDFVGAERAAVLIVLRGEWVVFGWDKHEGRCEATFAKREIVEQAFQLGRFVVATIPESSSSAAQSKNRTMSVLALPLLIREAVSGVMYLERYATPTSFTDDNLEFVAAVSNYIAIALEYSDKLKQLEAENCRMREEYHLQHEMVGQSARMEEVYKRIARIAPTDATVLIRGETGTGKELAARAIHENSPRAGQRFAAINCALLKGDLLESELFGHEKGSFTGAVTQKKGKLELANHGTVFLDEIAELPEHPQSMLLRVLQEHAFERLGGTSRIEVDIRIIAATNKDLENAVRAHKFREDLYYRLNVVSVYMPPLRERRDDIPRLAQHFLRRTTEKNNRVVRSISRDAMAYLQAAKEFNAAALAPDKHMDLVDILARTTALNKPELIKAIAPHWSYVNEDGMPPVDEIMKMQDYWADYYGLIERKVTADRLVELGIAEEATRRLAAEKPFEK